MSRPYFYLASVYSRYPAGIDAAFIVACKVAARFIKAGVPVFSPISHSHHIAIHGDIDPLSHDIWLPADRPMMDAACGIIVVRMEGWEESVGIAHEIEVFKQAGKPVLFVDP